MLSHMHGQVGNQTRQGSTKKNASKTMPGAGQCAKKRLTAEAELPGASPGCSRGSG